MHADLIDRFLGFCNSQNLFLPDERIVTAISGGGDSLALVDLFSRLNQPLVLAHCNFNLRGGESDEDEEFVRKIAVVYDLPVRVIQFETREYSVEKGISVEMAARELRYAWFEKIRIENSCTAVAVAHHADDSVETLFINLIRGTGIKGLSGIQPRQGKIIRPLLFTNRIEINNYLEFRHLEFREDSSNRDMRFVRNRIRHLIVPELEKINPSIRQTIGEEQLLFSQARKIIDVYTAEKIRSLVIEEDDRIKISLKGLLKEEFPETLLYEILRPYGFHGRQISGILAAAASVPGKLFKGGAHTLLVDREWMIISPEFEIRSDRYYFDPDQPRPELPLMLECRRIESENYSLPDDPLVAAVDYDKLDLPLVLRRWEKGDYFYPLGMNHAKKVSDFFIDRKVNRLDKSRVWILASGEQIIWIMGHRLDHRFRVTEETREILEIILVKDWHAD